TSTTSSRSSTGWTAASKVCARLLLLLTHVQARGQQIGQIFFLLLLDLLLRRGLGHGDARRLGRVGIKTLEVREALLRLFDQFIVLRDDVVVQKLVLRRDHEGLQADEALLGVAVLLGFRFGRFSFFLALALLLGVARARGVRLGDVGALSHCCEVA
ncbi:unnamed protein product, partial [Pelagomonas calceolata]